MSIWAIGPKKLQMPQELQMTESQDTSEPKIVLWPDIVFARH